MNKKGFTLIELLVVIAIIGILAALALVSFTSSQRQARDTQRKSDFKQYATALEAYANTTGGLYPSHTNIIELPKGTNSLCSELGLTNCPGDPVSNNVHKYQFVTNGGGSSTPTATQYVFWVQLEGGSNYWVECSNGKTGPVGVSTWNGSSYDALNNTVDCPL